MVDYTYLNNYFEGWLEDEMEDDDDVEYRNLTEQEFDVLNDFIANHNLRDKIYADIKKWESHPDIDDDYDPSVMSEDLEDLCQSWFTSNITL